MEDETTTGEETTSEESQTDKTEGQAEEKDESKNDTAIAQKKHWRDKATKASEKVQTLEKELAELRSMVKKPSDDAEAKAQEYIRTQAKAVYEELLKQKELEERKTRQELEEKVSTILEDNPDVSEEELLEVIEDLEVEPSVALKILKRQTSTKEKPKMPSPKRATASTEKETPDDSKKSMTDILKEEKAKLGKK